MVPKLTTKQRRAALDKGMQIRLERAEYKQKLKDGSMTVEQFFNMILMHKPNGNSAHIRCFKNAAQTTGIHFLRSVCTVT